MVEQTKDSAFTDPGVSYPESAFSNSDSEPGKKSALQDSHNEHSRQVNEISETKKPIPETPAKSSTTTNGILHKVYVRRRPETQSVKSSHAASETTQKHDAVNCTHPKKSANEGETTQQHAQMSEPPPMICTPVLEVEGASSSPSFSSRRCSISPPAGLSVKISPPGNAVNSYVHIDSGNPPPSTADPIVAKVNFWEERFRCLQNLLKKLDQSDQGDYLKMLRSMSCVELSELALELEKRSIMLSLEEARELQRVSMLDVLGKYQKINVHRQQQLGGGTTTSANNNSTSSTDQQEHPSVIHEE